MFVKSREQVKYVNNDKKKVTFQSTVIPFPIFELRFRGIDLEPDSAN